MGYLYALLNYVKTDKARWDLKDYGRALLVMTGIMAFCFVILDQVQHTF